MRNFYVVTSNFNSFNGAKEVNIVHGLNFRNPMMANKLKIHVIYTGLILF